MLENDAVREDESITVLRSRGSLHCTTSLCPRRSKAAAGSNGYHITPAAALRLFEVRALVGTALRAGYRGGRRFEATAASPPPSESMALDTQQTPTLS